jgi:hypothetical protein
MLALQERGILRTFNNPVADYAEWLVAARLNLRLANKSKSGHDAVDSDGKRYQIKGRRLTPKNTSTQLSVIRNLDQRPFDELAAVVFNADFSVAYAALVPCEAVLANSRYSKHQNGHIFMMRRTVLELPEVREITAQLAT